MLIAFVAFAKRAQVLPGINSLLMAVLPTESHRIITNSFCSLKDVSPLTVNISWRRNICLKENCLTLAARARTGVPESPDRCDPIMPVIPIERYLTGRRAM
jgi:hypothetical protein